MGMGPRQLVGTAKAGWSLRHPLARALVLRDLTAFVRLQWLGASSRAGVASALVPAGTAADVAKRAGLSDVELTEALLELGVALRQVRKRGDRYAIRGRRLRAIARGTAPDVSGLAEEATAYDGPIYAALDGHLRGAPPGRYLEGLGEVIARASRVAEPLAGPWIEAQVRARPSATRLLEVGCGSGVNLRWLAKAAPDAEVVGVDLDADAISSARSNVEAWGLSSRVRALHGDLADLPDGIGAREWDVVLLAQNLYYWPVEERTETLTRLRALAGTTGAVLAITGVPTRNAITRHLDLVLRVTEGCWRLPTRAELRRHATDAGFAHVDVRDIAPGSGMAALVAHD